MASRYTCELIRVSKHAPNTCAFETTLFLVNLWSTDHSNNQLQVRACMRDPCTDTCTYSIRVSRSGMLQFSPSSKNFVLKIYLPVSSSDIQIFLFSFSSSIYHIASSISQLLQITSVIRNSCFQNCLDFRIHNIYRFVNHQIFYTFHL